MTPEPASPAPANGPLPPIQATFDATRGLRPAPLRRVALAVAAAVVIALVLAPQSLADWVFNLPDWLGPVRDGLLAAAYWWADTMAALGLDQLFPWLRDLFRSFQPADQPW